jgi:hypothetical protein
VTAWFTTWMAITAATGAGVWVYLDDREQPATIDDERLMSFNFGVDGKLSSAKRISFGPGSPSIKFMPIAGGGAIVSAGYNIRATDFGPIEAPHQGSYVWSGLSVRVPKEATDIDGAPTVFAFDDVAGEQIMLLLDPSVSGYQQVLTQVRMPPGTLSRKLGRGIYRYTLRNAFPASNDALYKPLQILQGRSNLWQSNHLTTPSFAVDQQFDGLVLTDFDPAISLPPISFDTNLHYWPLPKEDIPTAYSFTATDPKVRMQTELAKGLLWVTIPLHAGSLLGLKAWRRRRVSSAPLKVRLRYLAKMFRVLADRIWRHVKRWPRACDTTDRRTDDVG